MANSPNFYVKFHCFHSMTLFTSWIGCMYFLYYYNYMDLHFIRPPSFAILVLKPVPRQDMPKRQKISQYHERPRKLKRKSNWIPGQISRSIRFGCVSIQMSLKKENCMVDRSSTHENQWSLFDLGAFKYDVRWFWGIFDLPTYPNQTLYYIFKPIY